MRSGVPAGAPVTVSLSYHALRVHAGVHYGDGRVEHPPLEGLPEHVAMRAPDEGCRLVGGDVARAEHEPPPQRGLGREPIVKFHAGHARHPEVRYEDAEPCAIVRANSIGSRTGKRYPNDERDGP